jgi:pimeloyl-ACP methyl ester carboxylesterase
MAAFAGFGDGPGPSRTGDRGYPALTKASLASAPSPLPRFKTTEGKARYMAAYDAVLQAWPVSYEEIDVPTRWGRTHVIASGPPEAPALVLLPSFAGAATVWRLNAEGLCRHFRTYALDVVGQPGKSEATRPMRNRRQYSDWLLDVLDGLGIQRASIVGCSFGGFLALSQASLTPDRVERVVMISPAGTFASQFWRLTYAMRIRAPLLKLARRLTGSKRAPSLADLGPRRLPRDTLWSALMGVTMSEAPDVSVINTAVFSRAELRAIHAPTLLLIGDEERLYEPHATLALAIKRMPALEGAIVPDADHIAAMAQPDDVNARIVAFLTGDIG